MAAQLQFHGAAAKLLPRKLRLSAVSAELVQRRQDELEIKFPESVREWYSLEGAVSLLASYSNQDCVRVIEDLGKPFDDWYGTGSRDFLAEKLLVFMHENQGVCNWAIILDGTPDPPVVVDVDTGPNPTWLNCADRFSTFVWCQIWDRPEFSYGAAAQDTALASADLDYLKSNFRQLCMTYGWPGKTNYRFESANSRILIWDGEDRGVDWFLCAATCIEMERLIGKVWHCGGLAKHLYEYGNGETERILSHRRTETIR